MIRVFVKPLEMDSHQFTPQFLLLDFVHQAILKQWPLIIILLFPTLLIFAFLRKHRYFMSLISENNPQRKLGILIPPFIS
jgi:hypothetical protein